MTVTQIIERYIRDIKYPKCALKYAFMNASYKKWAAEEMLLFIRQCPDVSEIDAVYIFQSMMNRYACRLRSNVFNVAYDVCMEIIDEYILEEEKDRRLYNERNRCR